MAYKTVKNRRVRDDQLVFDFCDPALDIGQSIRIPECTNCQGQGHQNGVQITRVEDGWTWWCYRCSHGGKFFDIGMSPADTLNRIRHMRTLLAKKYQRNVKLPDDFTTDVPELALTWLWGYEVDGQDVIDHDMGWSERYERLIIPVYISGLYGDVSAKGKMIAWDGRYFGKDKTQGKWHLVREFGIKYVYYSLVHPNTKILILVEDIISAIKMFKAGYSAVALLTTYVPNELYLGLKPYDLKVWLDPDAVGKSLKIVQKFNSVGVKARHIAYPEGDPKDCPLVDIPGLIE